MVEAVAVAETPRTGLAAAVEAKAERAIATTDIKANIFTGLFEWKNFF